MITITARLDPGDFANYINALYRVERQVEALAVNNGGRFNRECADSYKATVTSAIRTQEFSSLYQPYGTTKGSKKYIEWKKKAVGHRRFWILRWDLHNTIEVSRHKAGFLSGIRYGVIDRGGKSWQGVPGSWSAGAPDIVAEYGRLMEYGSDALGSTTVKGGRHPARPVFRPSYTKWRAKSLPRIMRRATRSIAKVWRGK